jgi:tetratricopeptide (TPR) repeat protein
VTRAEFDVFLSYAHEDAIPARQLFAELTQAGLRVWFDDTAIDDFAGIERAIERGLARSKAMVAFYSKTYPTKRACQVELTSAYLTALRGGDPRTRILVVNPEPAEDHIQPVELRDARVVRLADPAPRAAERIAEHVARLMTPLSALGPLTRPEWFGERPLGSARFVGRLAEMWSIHSALHASELPIITGQSGGDLVHVCGMGGTGKSLLVEEYALRFGAAYPGGVFWLRAGGSDGQDLGAAPEPRGQLVAFAVALGLQVEGGDPLDAVDAALRRAIADRGERCLWIIDDLPADVSRHDLNQWIAPHPLAKTLITTRSRGNVAHGAVIDLGQLAPDDAVRLLSHHRVPSNAAERRAAHGLGADLGYHAQALDVTGAALRAQIGIRTFAEQREALAVSTSDEIEFAAQLSGQLPNGHERSIATTLMRSVRALGPEGLEFIRLASTLPSDPISPQLVIRTFELADGIELAEARRRATLGIADAASHCLTELADEADGSRRVHMLISLTVRFAEAESQRTAVLRAAAVRALIDELRERARAEGPALLSSAVSHARALSSDPRDKYEAGLLSHVAEYDLRAGDYRSAESASRKAVSVFERLRDVDSAVLLVARENLAAVLIEQGQLDEARSLQEENVAIFRREFGDLFPPTTAAMGNLAVTARRQGDLDRARGLQERVLAIYQQTRGPDDRSTLRAASNLGVTLNGLGDSDAAEAIHRQVLEARRRVLGDDHPHTLQSLTVLASAVARQGRHADAVALEQEAWERRAATLGNDHPVTLTSLHKLAERTAHAGDLRLATSMAERAFHGRRTALGEQHDDTIQSRSTWHDLQDRSRLRALGLSHPGDVPG